MRVAGIQRESPSWIIEAVVLLYIKETARISMKTRVAPTGKPRNRDIIRGMAFFVVVAMLFSRLATGGDRAAQR